MASKVWVFKLNRAVPPRTRSHGSCSATPVTDPSETAAASREGAASLQEILDRGRLGFMMLSSRRPPADNPST